MKKTTQKVQDSQLNAGQTTSQLPQQTDSSEQNELAIELWSQRWVI